MESQENGIAAGTAVELKQPQEAENLRLKREIETNALLVSVGEKITTEHLIAQYAATEKDKSAFVVNAVRLGLMLEARFLSLDGRRRASGEISPETPPSFRAFADEVFGKGKERTLRTYRWLAKRFITAATAVPTPLMKSKLLADMQTIDKANAGLVAIAGGNDDLGARIKNFIAGRSLSELVTDLADAEKKAAREGAYDFGALRPAEAQEEEDEEDFPKEEFSPSAAEVNADADFEQLSFDSIFRDAEANTEDAIGFVVGKKEEVSPRVLAHNLRRLSQVFETKAKKAAKLAKQAEKVAANVD